MNISRVRALQPLPPTLGREIAKTRPVVIVSNDKNNEHSGTVPFSFVRKSKVIFAGCQICLDFRLRQYRIEQRGMFRWSLVSVVQLKLG
jgi:hypothetical protein